MITQNQDIEPGRALGVVGDREDARKAADELRFVAQFGFRMGDHPQLDLRAQQLIDQFVSRRSRRKQRLA